MEGECFHSSFEFSHTCTFFRKHRDEREGNSLFTLIIKMYILFARAIDTSTVCLHGVKNRNTIFNQSARVFLITSCYSEMNLMIIMCVKYGPFLIFSICHDIS